MAKRTAARAVRAAIYARISDDRAGDAGGVDRQQKDCRALAKSRGWTVADVFVDNDISASSFGRKARPEYERLLQAMRDKSIDAVVVWHEDRLHRQPRELEGFIDLANAHRIALATVTGDIDLATPEGRLRARMLGGVGAYESEHKAVRIRRKHEALAKDGKLSGGGTRPFGFERDRVTIRETEAELIRAAVTAVLAGQSVRAIATEWAARGVRSPAGKVFGPSAVRRLLHSGRIAGMREHHGEIVARAIWPAIVPPAPAARVREVLGRSDRRTGGDRIRKYELVGFLRCGLCAALLKSRPLSQHGRRVRTYICKAGPGAKGCGRLGIVAEQLEELITEQVFYRTDTPALAKAMQDRHRAGDDGLYEAIAADEAQLLTLAEDLAEKRLTRAEWLRIREIVEARVEAAKSRMARQDGRAALSRYVGRRGRLRAAWPALGLDERRAVLAALVDRIVISAAKRKGAPADASGRRMFDADRVAVDWRV
jgi:DNA invertase Pin-like site-specific DNA recombinase